MVKQQLFSIQRGTASRDGQGCRLWLVLRPAWPALRPAWPAPRQSWKESVQFVRQLPEWKTASVSIQTCRTFDIILGCWHSHSSEPILVRQSSQRCKMWSSQVPGFNANILVCLVTGAGTWNLGQRPLSPTRVAHLDPEQVVWVNIELRNVSDRLKGPYKIPRVSTNDPLKQNVMIFAHRSPANWPAVMFRGDQKQPALERQAGGECSWLPIYSWRATTIQRSL